MTKYHEMFRALAQEIYDKDGIRIDRAAFEWLQVGAGRIHRLIVTEVEFHRRTWVRQIRGVEDD